MVRTLLLDAAGAALFVLGCALGAAGELAHTGSQALLAAGDPIDRAGGARDA